MEKTATASITIRNMDLPVYLTWSEIKKTGKFSTWAVFAKWLVNNKSLKATIFDEIEKRLEEMAKEKEKEAE